MIDIKMLRENWKRPFEEPKAAWQFAMMNMFQRSGLSGFGTNFFERNWDHLVILDACRFDLFEEFGPDHNVYEKLDEVESVYSHASATPTWLSRSVRNTPSNTLADVNYISCTPFITEVDTSAFHDVEHVWKYAYDPDAGVTRPEAVTDAAIASYREDPTERSVIHYVQPHAPFLHCVGKYDSQGDESGGTQNVWRQLRKGKHDKDEVWEDYGQNLKTVLDHVELLVENLGGDIVVTSDHGNAFGELGIYGHPKYIPLPVIRRVPWARTQGHSQETYKVQGKESIATGFGPGDITERRRKEQLQALGYKT